MLNETTLREISTNLNEPNWILDNRLGAYEKYKNLNETNFKYGIGISVNVSELDFSQIDPNISPSLENVKAPKNVEIISFANALEKYPEVLREYISSKTSFYGDNKLTALHAAFFNNGIFIRIPEGVTLTEQIQISQDIESRSKIEYIIVIAEKNSKAVIIENVKSNNQNEKTFRSQIVEVIVKENANVEYISAQNLSSSTYNIVRRDSKVDRNGFMHWVDCSIGSKFTQLFTSTDLIGEGAGSNNTGIIFGDNTQCFDIKGSSLHSESNTISNMNSRVVLNNNAKAVYRGLVQIKPGAINCEGYQKEDTILLNENAHADIVPNLEIANNEVKCSHGATISQIDEDKLFYMMSRGLSENNAKKTIVEGFFDPIIIKIADEKLKEELVNSIKDRLESMIK
jgi:Fe-S cluster assembly protein SufD